MRKRSGRKSGSQPRRSAEQSQQRSSSNSREPIGGVGGGSRDLANTQETSRLSADSLEYKQPPSSGAGGYATSKENLGVGGGGGINEKNARSGINALKSTSMEGGRR